MINIYIKNKKLNYILIIIIFALSILALLHFGKKDKYNFNSDSIKNNSSAKYTENEEICLEFITKKMSSQDGGIYTNFLDTNASGDLAGGHQILSESEGIIMLYYIKTNNKEAFDKHFEIVTNKFLMDDGLIRWRISEKTNEVNDVSASIDDLRIMRSLLYAYSKWKDEKYINIFEKINNGLLKNNIYNGMITNFYDSQSKVLDDNINLSYIDLYTMEIIAKGEKNYWKKIKTKGLEIINSGYISDELPVYKKSYNLKVKKYDKDNKINMIDSLMVVLHLSEIGQQKSRTISWIKEQINSGALYGEYDVVTAQKMSNIESTAIYALTARIAKNIDDDELYNKSIEKMITLQIKNTNSDIYGSFGDEKTLMVFSFDNLQALLGF